MTVGALIEELKKYPQEYSVLVEGYEGGLSDISQVLEKNIILNKYKEDYYGPHEVDPSGNAIGVILFRASNPNSEF